MPRQAREKSETGIYHLMVRGISRQGTEVDSANRKTYWH